jgi:hypothetical protein
MLPMSPTSIALVGIRDQLLRFDEAAARLARTAPGPDMARDLVELNLLKYGVQANVATVRAADQMTGTLLDVLR